MYYELRNSPFEKFGVKKWPELPDGVYAFQSGDLITVDIDQPIEFIVDNTAENPPTDFVTSFMPVLSDVLINALKEAGVDNFQTYKAVLKNPETGESWSTYQVVNILGKIACADMEKSIYKNIMGVDNEFTELVIDIKKAKNALFFRLLESHEKIILHLDIAKKLFTADNKPIFKGLKFIAIKSSNK